MKCAVLIADDDPVCRLFCAHTLSTGGYRIFAAVDGESAIDKALLQQPGIVLADVHLPDMSGAEVMSRVCELWPAGSTFPKFIAVSGDDTAMGCAASSGLRFDFFLGKPFSRKALLSCIENCANGAELSRGFRVGLHGNDSGVLARNGRYTVESDLQTAFCLDLNRQLPKLDARIAALDWKRAAEILHRITGASAIAGFAEFARQGRILLLQISRANFFRLAESYPDFLLQATELIASRLTTKQCRIMHSE